MTTTSGSAKWQGGIKDGKGAISTKSGALKDYPYGFASRFEGKPGSNPEELIGAAHAACFTMALSLILGEAKLTAEQMETKADVTLEKQGDGFAITSVHLALTAKIPGADASSRSLTTMPLSTASPAAAARSTRGTTPAPITTVSHSIVRPSVVRTRSTDPAPSSASKIPSASSSRNCDVFRTITRAG